MKTTFRSIASALKAFILVAVTVLTVSSCFAYTAEVRTANPGQDGQVVWVPGHWSNGAWVPGHNVRYVYIGPHSGPRPYPGSVWVPAHTNRYGNFIPGHWNR